MKIRWTEGAVSNLDNVEEYIAQDNPSAAVATVNKIIDSALMLADYPTIGKRGRERGTRELVIASLPYIVIYALQREELVVLRVLHTSMKYP
jgi:addiction module RelE/StbE family toxin